MSNAKDKRRRHVSQIKKYMAAVSVVSTILHLAQVATSGTLLLQETPPIFWEEDKVHFVSLGEEHSDYVLHYISPCTLIPEFSIILTEKIAQMANQNQNALIPAAVIIPNSAPQKAPANNQNSIAVPPPAPRPQYTAARYQQPVLWPQTIPSQQQPPGPPEDAEEDTMESLSAEWYDHGVRHFHKRQVTISGAFYETGPIADRHQNCSARPLDYSKEHVFHGLARK